MHQQPCSDRPYPCVDFQHAYGQVEWHVEKTIEYLTAACGPTPESEEMRVLFLGVLRACQQRFIDTLPDHLSAAWMAEETALRRDCVRQRTHKQGVRRPRTGAPVSAVAD